MVGEVETMNWKPCKYVNQCFIPELESVSYSPFLVTYMTEKMKKKMVDIAWIERGRVLNKKVFFGSGLYAVAETV